MASQQFCTFWVDGNLFGVPVPQVQEVIRFQQITPVPLAPAVVEGMINLRGEIALAIDLRRRLVLGGRADSDVPMNVVVRATEGAISLLVDEIGDVIEVDPSTFEAPPGTVPDNLRSMILGVHKMDGRLLHVLDTEKVCHVGELSTAASA